MEENQTLTALQKQIRECRHCEKEFGYEPRPIVFGSADAKIMQISQAPGKKVHETGKPFNDLSGRKLREQWYQISDEVFYNPENFYITSAAHCYPGKAGRGNYDKKPPRCCFEQWTKQEMAVKKNTQLYILIGAEAAARIFPGRKMSDLVFEDLEIDGIPAFVLPHPSPLNRKWQKDHPEFENSRLPQIRQKIHEILGIHQKEENLE